MTPEAQRQKLRCRELLEAWGYEPTEAEDLLFADLATGDLFYIEGEGDYRKITPIVLPDVAPLNAVIIPFYHWRHVEEDRTVIRWGRTQPSLVDRVRAGEFEGLNLRDFEDLQSLRELKAQLDQPSSIQPPLPYAP